MKIVLIAAAAFVALVVVTLVVLGSVDMPAPSGEVQKTIPVDRSPH